MHFSRFYRTNIKKSLDEDRVLILARFQEILNRSALSLRLVNYYKGLPLSYPATLVEMNRGILELDVHQQQAVALHATRYTFIKCQEFDCPILAEVQNVDVHRMTASLRNFTFVDIMAEQRSALRLELEPQTEAEIRGAGVLLKGKLFDISLGGFSIRPAERCEFPDGSEVTLRVMVPNLLQNTLSCVETKAKHIKTLREEDKELCLFSIDADAQCEAVISRFMFQRQVEIIRELKEQL